MLSLAGESLQHLREKRNILPGYHLRFYLTQGWTLLSGGYGHHSACDKKHAEMGFLNQVFSHCGQKIWLGHFGLFYLK